ncbi:MAG TPA: energy transducer TonB [Terriglobales bacterium]|jgi:TonB family protein
MTRLILCIFLFTTVWAQTPTPSAPSPHVTKFVAPAYPWRAREIRMQGETTTELQVRADGTVESANVTMAHPFFRDYVEAALRQWEFEPTGKTFAQKVTVRFSLGGCGNVHSINANAYKETRVQAQLPQLVEVTTCTDLISIDVN